MMKFLKVRPMTAQEEFDRGGEPCKFGHYNDSHDPKSVAMVVLRYEGESFNRTFPACQSCADKIANSVLTHEARITIN